MESEEDEKNLKKWSKMKNIFWVIENKLIPAIRGLVGQQLNIFNMKKLLGLREIINWNNINKVDFP